MKKRRLHSRLFRRSHQKEEITTSTTAKPTLLTLPREIRDQIYLEALRSTYKQIWPCHTRSIQRLRNFPLRDFKEGERNGDGYEARIFPGTDLLLVNKQIYGEARQFVIKANRVLLRPPRRWPSLERIDDHVHEALAGSSSLGRDMEILSRARSLTLDPSSVAQLEVMVRVIKKKRTIPLEELVIATRSLVYPWDLDDFPRTEREIEDLFACLEGVRANSVRFEWPKYPCYARPELYRKYSGSYGAGWPTPVTDRVARRLMGKEEEG